GDLLDRIVALLRAGGASEAPPADDDGSADDGATDDAAADDDGELAPRRAEVVRLAVIGRPNVGKSSLVNRFLGTERVIVSERAGTTRDSIDTPMRHDGRDVVLIDTAGLRRGAQVAGSVGYYTALRSRRAAEPPDVAPVVCSAGAGVPAQETRGAELAT